MKQSQQLHRKITLIAIILVSLISFTSCRVTLIPNYDAEISQQIEEVSKEVDKFYLIMLETTENKDQERAYKNFVHQYVEIEVELNSLLNKNRVKPNNENSIEICKITIDLWNKYKEEHKEDNTLSDGIIKLNRATFNDLFYAMQVAEKGKEIISNPPN